MVAAAGGGGAFMAAFPNTDFQHVIIYFLLIGGTRIVLGASDGVSIALKRGLSHILLKWMDVPLTIANTAKQKKPALRAFEKQASLRAGEPQAQTRHTQTHEEEEPRAQTQQTQ